MQVFISYSQQDEEWASKIRKVLEKEGLDVWDEGREILPGDNWAEKVGEALQESEAMVVLLTPNSPRSTNVKREIEYALGEKRYKDRLIPVIVGGYKDFTKEGIPWVLLRLKPIHLPEHGEEESIKQIAHALKSAA